MLKRDYVLLVPILGMVAAYYYQKRFHCITMDGAVYAASVFIQAVSVIALGYLVGCIT